MAHDPAIDQPSPTAPALCVAVAEALADRLCHDLSGALGTLAGTLELARTDTAFSAEAMPLARDAAETLAHRLRFLRAAWGTGSVAVSLDGLQTLVACLPLGRRTRVRLDGLSPDRPFSAAAVRLLLNLVLVAVESLAGDGMVELVEAESGEVLVLISGPRAAWPQGFAGQLADPQAALAAASSQGPRLLPGPLTALIAHASGLRVAMLLAAQQERAPPLVVEIGA